MATSHVSSDWGMERLLGLSRATYITSFPPARTVKKGLERDVHFMT